LRITADTNLLVRAIIDDDPKQAALAREALLTAEIVALTLPALCELGWVLGRLYKIPKREIAETFRRLLNGDNVIANRTAVNAGLHVLDSGGDFADGVIAFEGRRLGGDVFLSFDRQAVRLVMDHGGTAQVLA
jgi:predicted nucleic-acid-binding protein